MAFDYIPYIRKKVGHDEILSVGLSCLILNQREEILLEKRSDNGLYCLPGGAIDLYETVLDGLKREIKEETGLTLDNPRLFAILSGEKNIFYYPNGDITHYVDLFFYAYVNVAETRIKPNDNESLELFFCPLDKLPKPEEFLRGAYSLIEKYKNKDFEVWIH